MTDVSIETHGRVLQITLDRPERKNALTHAMYRTLNEALDTLDRDPELRAGLITGAGGVFTAGNDLDDFMNAPPNREDAPVRVFLMKLLDLKKPLVAAVSGPAIGIGTTMLLHCDLAYADKTAAFQMPFVKLGLVPEAGSSVLVPALLGHRRAAELLLLSDGFGPKEARELGFINEVTRGAVLTRAMKRAQELAALPPTAVTLSKALMRGPDRNRLAQVIAQEGQLFSEQLQSPEAKEAFTAFFEKRPPRFD
ncbi:MAG: enoyl-CoA hydratase [Myxococcota bacterium]